MTDAQKARAIAIADGLTALSITAWVGGHAALGAYAARIVFRDLPRSLAAPTMTAIFRSFDTLMTIALLVVLLSTTARGLFARRDSLANRLAFYAPVALIALGIFELTYVHPTIEAMFTAGRTLEPAFQSLHKLSARGGHLEVVLSAIILFSHAFSRRTV